MTCRAPRKVNATVLAVKALLAAAVDEGATIHHRPDPAVRGYRFEVVDAETHQIVSVVHVMEDGSMRLEAGDT